MSRKRNASQRRPGRDSLAAAARTCLWVVLLLAPRLGATTPAVPSAEAKTSPANPDPETMTFTGQVLHGDVPIADATVSLWQRIGHEGYYQDWHPREATDVEPKIVAHSDRDGKFEFTFSTKEMTDTPWTIWPEPWKQVKVVVAKEGMGVGWCRLDELQSRQKIWIRGTTPVHGRVINLEGQPVPGCEIRFFCLSNGAEAYSELWQPTWTGLSPNVTTDADGRFVMHGLPTNSKGIRLWASGPAIATRIFALNLASTQDKPLEVIVEPTKPITGTVRDIETGDPIPGVIVYGDEHKHRRLVRAVTDERGEYRLIGLPKSGRYLLTTHAPVSTRYLVRYSSNVDSPGLTSITHDIQLRRGIPVHATVVDKRTRERLLCSLYYAPTDDNPLHEEASRGDYKPGDSFKRIHAPDENGVVRFLAYPGRGLIRIQLASGEYLPVGDTQEIVENSLLDLNFRFAALSRAYAVIHPQPGDDVVKLEMEADPGDTITGRLIDTAGAPVVGARITNEYFNAFDAAHSSPGGKVRGYVSWLGGRLKDETFTVYRLEPARPRMLVFLHEDRQLIGLAIATAGQPLEDVVLQKWAMLEGVLTDADGRPLPDVSVAVQYPEAPAEGFWPTRPSAKTDVLGRFVITRLLPGLRHKLTVNPPEGFQSHEMADLQPDAGERIDVGTIRLHKSTSE